MLTFVQPKEIILRPYQSTAIDALRSGIRTGRRRQVLCLATGGGKTLTAASLMKQASDRGSYSMFIVDRVSLVDQTSQTFDDYGIRHGVVQGNHPRWAPYENVQVCSAQTLANRSLPREPSLIVVDEAHVRIKSTMDYIHAHPNTTVIGLTATPFTPGMGRDWDGIVDAITARQLIDSGFLVQPKIYVAKSPDDVDLGLNSFGEFSDKSAEDAGIKIVGDVVGEWIKKTHEHFGGPAKTIVFSPTVEHGRELCAAFAAVGYNFQQVSYLDKDDDARRAKIEEFRRSDSLIHGLVSCAALTRGFDVPDILIGISCRPYRKSLSSHMQEIGRIMRSHPEKSKAIWICHSGNVERFAADMFDVWDNGVGDLSKAEKRDSTARKRDETTREKVKCPECGGAMRGNLCMSCGWERPARSGIHAVAGTLHEFNPEALGLTTRPGLRAEVLKDPRKVWEAALVYCTANTRKGEDHARKWAYGLFGGKEGIYPNSKLPFGWYGIAVPASVDQSALALVERETKRFRKNSKRREAA
ncbi:DEAD/DEAH box helicase [Pseudochelatococcus sp. B33]